MAKLSEQVRGQLRFFAFFLGNRTLDIELLDGIDYTDLFNEPSMLEMVFAIFGNVLEIDERGHVLNSGQPERRAAQYIRSLYDQGYIVEPPFELWETELHL